MSETTLHDRLRALGLIGAADGLDDLVALATKKRWSATQIFEHVADIEERERSRRGLERRLARSHLGRFKSIVDYDWNWPTKIDRPLVESVRRAEYAQPCLGFTLDNRPIDRTRAAELRQQRRVILDRTVARYIHEFLRCELQNERHDADVGIRFLHRLNCFRCAQRLELVNFNAALLRRGTQHVGTRAFFFRRAKHGSYGIAAREK